MRYQIPRGTQDILPAVSNKWQTLEQTLRHFCMLYDFKEIRTPIFEHTYVFKRENDSSDMVNKEMYTFQLENSTTSLTIRPEGTAGVVRSFVENKMYASPDLPVKLYYMGPMARHERPQKGRLRIFNQFGIESLGVKDPLADVEVITLAFSILKALGLEEIKVQLNTLGDEESRANYRQALREYFAPYVEELCSDCKRRYEQNPLRLLDCKIDHEKECMKQAPNMETYLNEASKKYFETVCSTLQKLDIPYEVDPKLVRGLDYYTHTVFEIVSLNQEMGAQSTVLAGGRYDGLIPYFHGPKEMSGIGWALGMERLLIALEAEGINLEEGDQMDAFVMVLDQEAKEYAFEILTELRAYGYKSDMDYMNRSFKAQFKAVDRTHAKTAILIGSSEMESAQVTIKLLKEKKQVTIPREELVAFMDANLIEEEHHHHEEGEEHE